MSRVSKTFRSLFMSKSSKSIWHLARRNVFLPDLQADDMSEAAYALLVFERNCMVSRWLPLRRASRSESEKAIELPRRCSCSSFPSPSQVCGKGRASIVDYFIRARWCRKCKKAK